MGEIGGNYATLCNILQLKNHKETGAQKNRAGMGSRKFNTPVPPPTLPERHDGLSVSLNILKSLLFSMHKFILVIPCAGFKAI